MIHKTTPIFALVLFFNIWKINAQVISADMDSLTGIQGTYTTKDTAQTVTIAFRISGADAMFSYQFKVAFDTAHFTFTAAQSDYGSSGEKNILTKNSGTTIGINQLQVNPSAPDTVEFSNSITGTSSSKCVSGDGLAGVLYLKSKVPFNDSSKITVTQGYSATFSGDLTPFTSYNHGIYKVQQVVGTINCNGTPLTHKIDHLEKIEFQVNNKPFFLEIPSDLLSKQTDISICVFSINGKVLAYDRVPVDYHKIGQVFKTPVNQTGVFLYCISIGKVTFTRTVTVP